MLPKERLPKERLPIERLPLDRLTIEKLPIERLPIEKFLIFPPSSPHPRSQVYRIVPRFYDSQDSLGGLGPRESQGVRIARSPKGELGITMNY